MLHKEKDLSINKEPKSQVIPLDITNKYMKDKKKMIKIATLTMTSKGKTIIKAYSTKLHNHIMIAR